MMTLFRVFRPAQPKPLQKYTQSRTRVNMTLEHGDEGYDPVVDEDPFEDDEEDDGFDDDTYDEDDDDDEDDDGFDDDDDDDDDLDDDDAPEDDDEGYV